MATILRVITVDPLDVEIVEEEQQRRERREKNREAKRARVNFKRERDMDGMAAGSFGYASKGYRILEDLQEIACYAWPHEQDEAVAQYLKALHTVCALRTDDRREPPPKPRSKKKR